MEKLLKTVYAMLVHFTAYSASHNPPTSYKIYRRKQRFSIFTGFQNAYENEFFHGFGNVAIWLWKGFGNLLLYEPCIGLHLAYCNRLHMVNN